MLNHPNIDVGGLGYVGLTLAFAEVCIPERINTGVKARTVARIVKVVSGDDMQYLEMVQGELLAKLKPSNALVVYVKSVHDAVATRAAGYRL